MAKMLLVVLTTMAQYLETGVLMKSKLEMHVILAMLISTTSLEKHSKKHMAMQSISQIKLSSKLKILKFSN
jgi:hypothetical protein